MSDTPPAAPGDVLLTPAEVGKMARLTERALASRRCRGQEPAYIKLSPGRTGPVRYWRSTVDAWLGNGTTTADVA